MLNENEEKWLILNTEIQKAKIVEAFKVLREQKIEPILIKGYAIQRFYPVEKNRIFFDIDLAVSIEDYLKARKIVSSKSLSKVNIDLHRELRHLDDKNWSDLFNDSTLIEINNYKIRVLSEEDHLRVICVHWLTDGGENKRKLWDIFYAVSNRSEDFDWAVCFEGTDKKRALWIKYSIGLAHKYLGLDISDLPFKETARNLPGWLTRNLESIWDREYPFIPLDACYRDPKMFMYQIRLRFPPNPIMATIGVNGSFDKKSVIIYQLKYIAKRSIPSIRSFVKYLTSSKNAEK